jgi:hypothetical protein
MTYNYFYRFYDTTLRQNNSLLPLYNSYYNRDLVDAYSYVVFLY